MSRQIAISQSAQPADIRNARGAIAIGVTPEDGRDGGQPMISITAAVTGTSGTARLTIEEAEALRSTLDTMISEANARLRHSGGGGERSVMAELLTTEEANRLEIRPGMWLLPGAPP